MHPHRPVILLTGFGPFPRVETNASSILVPQLVPLAGAMFCGYRVVGDVLATEWQRAPRRLDALIKQHAPVLAIHFGVSDRARGFVIEKRAVNAAAQSADGCGEKPTLTCLEAEGAPTRSASLPALQIVERLRRRGIPAEVSRDAGTYLCNAILYRSRTLADTRTKPFRSGFVHLPSTLADGRRGLPQPRAGCPLSWDQVMLGSLEVIATALGQRLPAPRRSQG